MARLLSTDIAHSAEASSKLRQGVAQNRAADDENAPQVRVAKLDGRSLVEQHRHGGYDLDGREGLLNHDAVRYPQHPMLVGAVPRYVDDRKRRIGFARVSRDVPTRRATAETDVSDDSAECGLCNG